jgi:hypothetical protein
MKAWERARGERRCGQCGQLIAIGQPLLLFGIAGHAWRKVRCVGCAEDPVPADLPPLELPIRAVPMTPIQPMAPIGASLGLLPLDWKRRAAVERDPGEEG